MNQQFQQVLNDNDARLVRIARQYAGPKDWQDLLQEIAIALWKGLPSFAGRSSLSTWVYRVAVNTALQHVRKRPVATEALATEPMDSTDVGDPVALLERFLASLDPVNKALLMAALFGLWLTGVCVYIPLRLRHARRMIPTPDPGRPVIEFLRAERAAMGGQRELLGSVWRWYWGPIAIGVIGFFVSIKGWDWMSAAYVLIVVAMSARIETFNRKAIRDSITPGLEALDRQIQDMEAEDEA